MDTEKTEANQLLHCQRPRSQIETWGYARRRPGEAVMLKEPLEKAQVFMYTKKKEWKEAAIQGQTR
jgi:hypothetical protein